LRRISIERWNLISSRRFIARTFGQWPAVTRIQTQQRRGLWVDVCVLSKAVESGASTGSKTSWFILPGNRSAIVPSRGIEFFRVDNLERIGGLSELSRGL
jgi:hypothetical protein